LEAQVRSAKTAKQCGNAGGATHWMIVELRMVYENGEIGPLKQKSARATPGAFRQVRAQRLEFSNILSHPIPAGRELNAAADRRRTYGSSF
jgi:hypothetical protein